MKSRASVRKPSATLSKSVLDRARRGERIVLRQGRRAVAAVVPIADLRLLQKLEDEKDLRDVRAARIEMKRKGTTPWEKVRAERYDVAVSVARLANPREKRIPYAEVRRRAGL